MKRFFTPLAILLCFLASSCMREESLLVPSKWREARMKSLVINASHGQDTKTVVPDAGTTVLWDADETIKVFGVEGDAAFKSTNPEPAATTQFGGSLKYSNGDKIFGLYPWSEDAQRVNDTIITNVPYFQLGRANSFAKDMNISIAESSTLDMHFFNVCGGVRFTLDRGDIYRIVLESVGGEPLAGRIKVFFEEGLPQVKSVSDTCSRVILNTADELPFQSGKWYYVEFIPGEITQGFKISFYSTDGQKGTATLSKPVTIRRGIFLSKESIDNNVTFWETIEDESPAIRETDLEVEIPVEAEASYISKLKLSNYYGEYGFNSMAYSTGKRRSYGPEPTNSTNVYGVNYKYAGDGLMFQFLLNDKDDVVMSCIVAPNADNTMSAESTAIQLLMTTPELITDNIEDFNATVAALRQLDAFDTYVRQVRDEMNAAVKEGKSPNYASIDQNPVFNALISMFKQTTDSWQGLDLLDIERDTDLRTIMLKVRNHYHRVVHIYSRRVWMTDNNMGELRSEDAGFKLSEVMKAIAQAGTKQMSSLSADFGNFEIDEDYVDMALDIMSEMDFSKMDIIPFPYFLEPENAGYLETVIGTWYWKETSTPFEATTDDLTFKMKDADKLFIDVYGLGKYDSFSTLSNQEQLQIVAVILHSVYKDFVVPIIKLAAGVKNMDDALDGFHYDLRYGARAAPLQAFFIKLLSNFSPSDMAELATNLENHDYGMAFEQILIFVVDQVFQNPDEGDMATYHNLLYNTFKKYIWKPLSGSAATSLAFRTGLKSVWNKLSVAQAAATLSAAVLNVVGSAAAVYTSDGKTTFILDMEPDPYVTLLSPLPDAVIKEDKIELSWDMHMGNRVGNIAYDVRFFQKNATNVSEKTFRELVSKSLTVNLTDLPLDQSDEKVYFQIIAHKPNAPDMIYARSEVTPIHIASFRKPIEAIDLGLPSGLKWGSMNLGATLPEEPGDYFAWGETEPVGDRPYEWGDSSEGGIIKYNTDSTKGVLDGLTQLELADDAASAQLKGYWRMPTAADFAELQEYCDLTWTTRNGVKGLQVTSKTNSNYVFMPAVGYYGDGSDYVRGTGWYWSSTLDADRPDFARYVQLYGGGINASSFLRSEGLSIRPVYQSVRVESVTLNKDKLTLGLGQRSTLVATILPDNATDKEVTWSSSDSSIAVVSDSGEVTGVSSGNALVTVTTKDGGKTANCSVTVGTSLISIPEVIDMGFTSGVKWASFNVGASNPEESGDYYAWGETEPKKAYTWNTYKWCEGTENSITKYNTSEENGIVDNITVLEPADDVAQLKLGGKWRMPTYSDFKELLNNCTKTLTTLNGVSGYLFESKLNGNSIFLPRCGNCVNDYHWVGYSGEFWTSTLLSDSPTKSYRMIITDNQQIIEAVPRYVGRNVRAVYEDYVPVKSVSIDKNNVTLIMGQSDSLVATVFPINASNQNITWSSSDLDVAIVSTNGVVRGLSVGEAVITVKTQDGNKIADCSVRVGPLPDIIVPDAVDMGLPSGVKWASFNLGSNSPEIYGNYYAWGETETKSEYTWENYKWRGPGGITKYIYEDFFEPEEQPGDGKTILELEDDVAHVKLGGSWRMPTKEDYEELIANSTREKMTVNGVTGIMTTSTINGNGIFFPASKKGVLWTSSLDDMSDDRAVSLLYEFFFHNFAFQFGEYYRCEGHPVRAVFEEEKPPVPVLEAVDLGLPSGTKWANMNLGASAPEEYGDYYSWGEIEPKDDYSWTNYSFRTSGDLDDNVMFSKYNTQASFGPVDNKTNLDLEDDVAHVRLGGKWRMPTADECNELENNCTSIWTSQNGVNGRLLTSKVNGNSIFLPAAGYWDGSSLISPGSISGYWSSSLNTGTPRYAYSLFFHSGYFHTDLDRRRFWGYSVRPVTE